MHGVAGNVKLDSDFDTEKIRARITTTDGPGAHGVRPYRLLAKAWAPRRERDDLAPRLGVSKHLQQRGSALVLPRAKRRLNRSVPPGCRRRVARTGGRHTLVAPDEHGVMTRLGDSAIITPTFHGHMLIKCKGRHGSTDDE